MWYLIFVDGAHFYIISARWDRREMTWWITMQLRYLKKLDVDSGGDYSIDRYNKIRLYNLLNMYIRSNLISSIILFVCLFTLFYIFFFSFPRRSNIPELGISYILQICNNKKYSKNRTTIKTRFKKTYSYKKLIFIKNNVIIFIYIKK